MAFSNPIFLWGLLALSIPIIIHLFDFRQTKKVYFSNTRFLREVKETTQKKRKLKEWLILLSRLAFLFFIVMAFAQPYFKSEPIGSEGEVIIYIDNSKSMDGEFLGGSTKFDQSIKFAQDIISKYPDTYRYQLFDNSLRIRPGNNKTKKEAEDWLSELSTSWSGSRLLQFDGVLMNDFPSQSHDIYLISDFQGLQIGEIKPFSKDTVNYFHFVQMMGDVSGNVFIDSVFLQSPFYIRGEPNALMVSLFNSSDAPSDEVIVRLIINGDSQGSTSVTIPSNENVMVEFPIQADLPEQSEIQLKLEEFPNIFDNEFYLNLTGQDRLAVIELGEASASPFISGVFGNPSLFNYRFYSAGNFDYTLLEQTDLIVLNSLRTISSPLVSNLNNFVSKGGIILLIPEAEPDLNAYRALEGLKIIGTREISEFSNFSNPDSSNPVFKDVFTELPENLELPSARIVLNLPSQETTLISLRNGSPFLMASGPENRLLTFASPLSEEFTNLPRHALFVPLMYKIASMSRMESSRLYARMDEKLISLKVEDQPGERIYKLRKDNIEIIPNQRRQGSRLLLELEEAELSPGIYQLLLNDVEVQKLAINLSKRESFQEYLTPEGLKRLSSELSRVQVLESEELSTFEKKLESRFQGTPLWKYALMLALLFFFSEILIIRYIR